MAANYSDNFNRGDGLLGANWIYDAVLYPVISSNAVKGTQTDGFYSQAAWLTQLGADQSSQLTITAITAEQSANKCAVALACRCSTSNLFSVTSGRTRGYYLVITTASGSYTISSYWVGNPGPGVILAYDPAYFTSDFSNSAVLLGYNDSAFITAGDVWRLKCISNSIQVFRNGTLFLDATDSSLNSPGYTGFGISPDEDGMGIGSPFIDDWYGVDYTSLISGWEQGGNVQVIEREGILTG